ncbi:phosphotransferase [Labrenzia sp. DG1229]|uniref:phosphotransferase enzyme family protein n=1 Tax=Labrenzia sp. DG1229 TaxID=681847 RepID=UPI0007C6A51E|nr:phosphotransferase [Labrenzia sp. DG1229]
MHEDLADLLALWGMENAQVSLVAARENQVFKVFDGARTTALRLHRRGLRSSEELQSELAWMAELSRVGISVPSPVTSDNGEYLRETNGQQVSMLSWMSGSPLGRTGEALEHPDRKGTFRKLGQLMARVHAVSDRWSLPAGFTRASWGRKALVGPDPLWGRFWENPDLDNAERKLLLQFRTRADIALKELKTGLDTGLIHADLVRENVMVEGETLHLIDFDDGGFGFRLFDIATALIKNRQEPDYPELREAMLRAYCEKRPIDTSALDLFLALRAVTYVGWIIPRLEEDGGLVRNKRMISEATTLAETFLSTSRVSTFPNLEVSP